MHETNAAVHFGTTQTLPVPVLTATNSCAASHALLACELSSYTRILSDRYYLFCNYLSLVGTRNCTINHAGPVDRLVAPCNTPLRRRRCTSYAFAGVSHSRANGSNRNVELLNASTTVTPSRYVTVSASPYVLCFARASTLSKPRHFMHMPRGIVSGCVVHSVRLCVWDIKDDGLAAWDFVSVCGFVFPAVVSPLHFFVISPCPAWGTMAPCP